MNLIVLCDFDGTVLSIDTCEFILDKFAKEDWRIFDRQLERGEITLEECLRREFKTVAVSETVILKEIDQVARVRPNFDRLVEHCKKLGLRLVLVSAGMDFVIRHILGQKGWLDFVGMHGPKAKVTVHGITFDFPDLFGKSSVNFKDDLVKHYQKQGKEVIYVGDGMADYEAAKCANLAFAITNSKLAELLRRNNIPYEEINDFREVVRIIETSFSNS